MVKVMKNFIKKIFTVKTAIIGFLLGTMALLLYSYSLPFMEIEKLIFFKSQYSLMYSLKSMWEEDFYFLASIIFLFSMVFPIVKLIAIAMLYFFSFSKKNKERILNWLGILGKWSMLDVYVVAILIVLVKAQSLVYARPCIGIYIFAVAIMFSMILSYITEKGDRE
jgi:paraquat-inducible protein A